MTGRFIKNNSGQTKNYGYGDLPDGETWEFPSQGVLDRLANKPAFVADVLSGDIAVVQDENELKPKIGMNWLRYNSPVLTSSLALDKDGTNQSISGNGWTVVTANRVLWDINEDYDNSTNDFVVPIDAVYRMDALMVVKNIVQCQQIELAIFKRGEPDDYWFLVDRKYPALLSLQEVVLSNNIAFDFYSEERYCLKIKMTPTILGNPQATIDGDDDYTAWGYDLSKKL